MHLGLDALPLASPKTGVGHYTFELARALASIKPSSTFKLVYPSTYPEIRLSEEEDGSRLPENLDFQRVRVGPLVRHWWSAGLPHYIRHGNIELFHGPNFDILLWRPCPTVLTIHNVSQLLHPAT